MVEDGLFTLFFVPIFTRQGGAKMNGSGTPLLNSVREGIHPLPASIHVLPRQPARQSPKLLDQLREALRSRHYSHRTEATYCHWVKRYIFFHHVRHPAEMAEPEINRFLTHLAVREHVSASTQNQALCALLFLYRHVLRREIGDLGEVIRARKPKRLPVVMTREEVKAVLAHLVGDKWLMASLMYGAGLRLMECLRLRVQDVDISRNEITVRDGKGAKDRITMVPTSLKGPLQQHLTQVKTIHEKDLAAGWGRVQLPDALERKYPNAPREWRWQWVFPQEKRWKNPRTQEQGRHHIDDSLVQKAIKDAVIRAGLTKRASCHTFRPFFCYSSLGRGLRHSNGTGTPWSQRCKDDYDLYACFKPRTIRRAQSR